MDSRTMRRHFVAGLFTGLRVVWPILSVLLGLIIALGLIVASWLCSVSRRRAGYLVLIGDLVL